MWVMVASTSGSVVQIRISSSSSPRLPPRDGIYGGRGDPGFGGDVVDLGGEVAAFGEQLARGVEDRLPGRLGVLLAAGQLPGDVGHRATIALDRETLRSLESCSDHRSKTLKGDRDVDHNGLIRA